LGVIGTNPKHTVEIFPHRSYKRRKYTKEEKRNVMRVKKGYLEEKMLMKEEKIFLGDFSQWMFATFLRRFPLRSSLAKQQVKNR
jgi:hypothetical protein